MPINEYEILVRIERELERVSQHLDDVHNFVKHITSEVCEMQKEIKHLELSVVRLKLISSIATFFAGGLSLAFIAYLFK